MQKTRYLVIEPGSFDENSDVRGYDRLGQAIADMETCRNAEVEKRVLRMNGRAAEESFELIAVRRRGKTVFVKKEESE
jgi:hypothetical protein